jgi:hypothetical protein
MERALIDRWTDTAAFRAALFFSAVLVLPVLALGLVTTVGMLVAAGGSAQLSVLDGGSIALPSLGGALGIAGLVRAQWAARTAKRHNVTVTLICLAIGIATALGVAGVVVAELVTNALALGKWRVWASIAAAFVAAHACWVLWGIAWMQRLMRRYAERTGHAYDATPAILLGVAIALATSAAFVTGTL